MRPNDPLYLRYMVFHLKHLTLIIASTIVALQVSLMLEQMGLR